LVYDDNLCNFLSILKNVLKHLVVIIGLTGAVQPESLVILNPRPRVFQNIPVIQVQGIQYFSVNRFATTLGVRTYYRAETGKIALFFDQSILKLVVNTSFCMLDERMVQLPSKVILGGDQIFAPYPALLELVQQMIMPNLQYTLSETAAVEAPPTLPSIESRPSLQPPEPTIAHLREISFVQRQNGLTIKLNTNKRFQDTDFSYFFRNDWLYVTIYGATCDSNELSRVNPLPTIERLEALPLGKSVQISLKLNRQFERTEVIYDERNHQILISLFLPLSQATLKKIEEVKNKWIVDTIVLDAGHGGHDPGTPGRWGYWDEKDLVLDIALRVGELLKRRKDIKVVYTRQKDEFVPLWRRTKIANDAGGKLFLSFHVNAMLERNKGSAEGIELYLQNPTIRTKEAIEVAKLENAVIQMETNEDKAKYKNYDNPSHILANMVFQTYLHDSEKFAEILSKNLSKSVNLKNRGVKQANFYVLVGASMPNLLCEFGYNDNKNDAKKLNDPTHRQRIAEAVYRSIIEFKEYCDRTVK
jgi:N-acetylmuramoyl-L-alanine amidase